MDLKIIKLSLTRIKNESHVQFHESVHELVGKTEEAVDGLGDVYIMYGDALSNEKNALDYMRQSDLTGPIAEQDKVRNGCYRGFAETMYGLTLNYDPIVKESAIRLNRIIAFYGNVTQKPINAKTAAINDLLRELTIPANAEALAKTPMMEQWAEKLGEENNKFHQMMMQRFGEASAKTQLRMAKTRKDTDKCYRVIIGDFEKLILTGADNPVFVKLITELNAIIMHYKSRIGSKEKGVDKPEPTE